MEPIKREPHVSPTRPILTLKADADGVPRARQMVSRACRALGRSDLLESAQLGVSELVTNAVLHVGGKVEVRVAGTVEHPRIEVRDSSTGPPSLAEVARAAGAGAGVDDVDEDELLLSVGRGLRIVSRCSDAWGVDLDERGKVVWFSPALHPVESGVAGTVSGLDQVARDAEQDPDSVLVLLRRAPVALHLAFRRHFRELSREIRLLALAHKGSYPVAADLAEIFVAMERWVRTGLGNDQVDAARASGADYVDLEPALPRSLIPLLGPFRDDLDRADVFCRDVRLLTLARTRDQVEFTTWLLTELERQAEGAEPRAWRSGPSSEHRRSVTA